MPRTTLTVQNPPPAARVLSSAVAAILVVAASLPGLNRQLWQDEYATWWAANLPLSQLRTLTDNIDFAILPYYLLMHFWVGLFGDSPQALRAPSIIAMAVAAILVSQLATKLFGGVIGLTAGVLFAILPAVGRYTQEARPYAIATAAAVLASLLLVRAVERPTFWRWAAYAPTLILLGAAHLVAMTLLIAHLIAVVQAARRRGSLRLIIQWAITVAVAVAPVVPIVVISQHQSAQIAWNVFSEGQLVAMPANLFRSGILACVILAFGAITVAAPRPGRGRHLPLLIVWAVVPFLLTLATTSWLHMFLSRYLLFTVPAFVILAAVGLCDMLRSEHGTITRIGVAVLVIPVLALFSLHDQHSVRANPVKGQPDYRQAAATVTSLLRPGDGITYIGPTQPRTAFSYQMRRQSARPRDLFLQNPPPVAGGWFSGRECDYESRCLGATRRLWVVSTIDSGDPYQAMRPARARLLQAHFRVARKQQLTNVWVFLLTRSRATVVA
ncbi:glycosyltransferase family 39 protein [Actinoplanes bogorensis]|uniref:Glycosyltransferase family 39 protein n=1 Tax=Paractinoplanes bogorensis TaxID=1610840 RepID=A0ABS5YS67_9ACTN|nr:glycosyltransferase family 39 protein [Actinoplanes bogorensis]MBU2666294.1 glycosyltransferase family 39 protein [Actinoplanes bogorensis]